MALIQTQNSVCHDIVNTRKIPSNVTPSTNVLVINHFSETGTDPKRTETSTGFTL
jgi:hypothetical protein